jgi:hypothetical protein
MVEVGIIYPTISDRVNDHPAQRTQVASNGCRNLFGTRLRSVGAINQNDDMNFLLCMMYFRRPVGGRPGMSIEVIRTLTMNDSQTNPDIETGPQQRGKLLPRIASLFQFLRDPEPGIERVVNEMDKVASARTAPPTANTDRSVWRIPLCRITSD